MDLELSGRVVVVTGGASNIGRAISQLFAIEGATVAILDRDKEWPDARRVRSSWPDLDQMSVRPS